MPNYPCEINIYVLLLSARAFLSPPSTCLLNLVACRYSTVKEKPPKQKQKPTCKGKRGALVVKQSDGKKERQAPLLLTPVG